MVTVALVVVGSLTVWLAQANLVGALDREMTVRAQLLVKAPGWRSGFWLTEPSSGESGARERGDRDGHERGSQGRDGHTRTDRAGRGQGDGPRLPGPVRLRDVEDAGDVRLLFQVVTPSGQVRGSEDIPQDAQLIAKLVADAPVFRTVEIDGRPFRRLTLKSGGTVVQIASDMRAIQYGLRDLRRGLVVVVVVGSLAAGCAGWFVARRLTKPLVDVTAATSMLADGQGVPEPIHTSSTDEVGRLARSFNELVAKLQASKEQQKRLVADASHELRTPLTTLRMNIEFLESTPDVPEAVRAKVLSSAAVELESLTFLVNELVLLAAHEAEPEAVAPVDLGAVVAGAVARCEATSGREVRLESAGTQVLGQEHLLTRAVTNLLTNAAKYSPAGSVIVVREGAGRVEVQDAGSGFVEAELPFVFDRFFRSAQHQSVAGSGIGLAIVHQTAQAHGGTVWAQNVMGEDGSGVVGAVVGFSVRLEDPA